MKRNGSLHILRLGLDPVRGEYRYYVTYARYDRRGGALPPYVLQSDSELLGFMREIGVEISDAASTLGDLKLTGHASLHNVGLTNEQLRKYGLEEMGVLESVISYLST
ncbi:MAG: hypothetical protein HYR86_14060 [Candidatus Rokubacteria bacterium]|nr:hypothetical protein [Candidatus Rokubacteria bacterium]